MPDAGIRSTALNSRLNVAIKEQTTVTGTACQTLAMPGLPDPEVLSRVLTHPETVQKADLPHLLAAGLGGAVRARLPSKHPLRADLRAQALDLSMRHARIRAELRLLLAAWASESIPFMPIKGFALAEFEYPTPGERFYGDVDILLPGDERTVWRAAHLAIAHGWRSDGQHADQGLWTHETMHLYSPEGHVRLDVHRYAVPSDSTLSAAQLAELTAGVWQRAHQHDWQGIPTWRPNPLDAAVVNVALGRCWGGDSGGIKPADYNDLHLLVLGHGLTSDGLAAHAKRLGGQHTWRAFRQVCDPFKGHLMLTFKRTSTTIQAGLRADGVRTPTRFQSRATTLKRLWGRLPVALLDVIAAWWALRQGGDPREHLRGWTSKRPRPLRRLSRQALADEILAVSGWTRLFYPRQRRLGICVPRAYATYRALRRAGYPAVFVSGVAKTPGGITGHAWVEDDQGEMELYGEPHNRRLFQIVFTYPPHAGSEAVPPR